MSTRRSIELRKALEVKTKKGQVVTSILLGVKGNGVVLYGQFQDRNLEMKLGRMFFSLAEIEDVKVLN
jgi:hypothetical protein